MYNNATYLCIMLPQICKQVASVVSLGKEVLNRHGSESGGQYVISCKMTVEYLKHTVDHRNLHALTPEV